MGRRFQLLGVQENGSANANGDGDGYGYGDGDGYGGQVRCLALESDIDRRF